MVLHGKHYRDVDTLTTTPVGFDFNSGGVFFQPTLDKRALISRQN
ncbi:hypothetical protein NSP_36890 [Nodularia spumigena CCY9414]|nr:hypothetical protein NSP_36890 [Nodularia spumigena CCY9414]